MPTGVKHRSRSLPRSIQGWFHMSVLASCLCVLMFEILIVPLLGLGSRLIPDQGDIPQARKEQLDLYKDRVQNLILLALAMGGAAAAAAYNRYAGQALPDQQLRILSSCWILLGLSVCSGLWGRFQLERLLAHRLLEPEALPPTFYPSFIQLVSVIAAAPFLCWFLFIALKAHPRGGD
jgi:hypothetical protein